MSGTTMVFLIVLVSVGFGVIYDMYSKYLKFKERTVNKATDEQLAYTQSQITDLQDRIKVLEKIVTDEGYNVNQEINKL